MTPDRGTNQAQGRVGTGESLHTGITRWAGRADVTVLLLLAILGSAGAALVLTLDWRRWPLAGILLSVGAVGGWGLLDQKATFPHSRLVMVTEWLLAGVGGVAAAMAALGILFWLLGPAPIL